MKIEVRAKYSQPRRTVKQSGEVALIAFKLFGRIEPFSQLRAMHRGGKLNSAMAHIASSFSQPTPASCRAEVYPRLQESPSTECSEAPGRETILESVRITDQVFLLECSFDNTCADWKQTVLNPWAIPVSGPEPPFVPEFWPIALTMTKDVKLVGEESIDEQETLHLQGQFNSVTVRLAADEEVLGESIPEVVAGLKDEERLYEANPASIDVWVSRQTLRVHRIAIDIPEGLLEGQFPPRGRLQVEIKYSRFDDVSVQVPDQS